MLWRGWVRRGTALVLLLAATLPLPVVAQGTGRKNKEKEPQPDLAAELDKVKAEFEQRLAAQEAAARKREDDLRQAQEAALADLRRAAEEQRAAEASARAADVQRLQQAVDDAAVRAEARAQAAPPSVGIAGPGVGLYGYVQGDYQIRQSSTDQLDATGQPLNQDRFLIRRARLGATLSRGHGEGRFEVDGNTVNGPVFRLVGAEASVKWPAASGDELPVVKGTIGLFRTPFGREVPQDDRDRLFLERSTAARALFPGEADVGARLAGGWHFVRYDLAVLNGQPLGGSAFAGLDPNHQKDVMGRLGLAHALAGVEVAAGLSALRGTGFHAGAQAQKPVLQWTDADENGSIGPGELTGSPGLAASASSSFTRVAFGADAAAALRLVPWLRASLAAELYLASDLDRALFPADPRSVVGRSYREVGYYVALALEMARWRLGVRFDYYNPDQDANKNAKGSPVPTDASYATLAVVAGCTAPWGRFLVEYDHNRNHLGIGSNGLPANLGDDALLARGEVSF